MKIHYKISISVDYPVPVSFSGSSFVMTSRPYQQSTVILSPALMLMYGKEASNRKQEIDRQYHTIPNQRPEDKHCGKIQKFRFYHNADYYGIPLLYIFVYVYCRK